MKLAPLTRSDCQKVRQWRNEDLAFLRTPYFLTEEMQADFYDTVINNRDSKHRYFAVYEMIHVKHKQEVASFGDGYKSNRFIGMVGLTNIEWENGCAEISIILDPDARGMGYGMKAVDLLLEHAFNSMRLETVYGEVYACGNVGFWEKVIEFYGFYSTTLLNRKYYKGSMWNAMWFSITRDKFLRIKKWFA